MSMTTQSFLSALSAGISSKASATRKNGAETRTIVLRAMPDGMSDDDFIHAARVHGVDGSLKYKTDDNRTKTANGKEIYGDKAVDVACDVLGVSVPSKEGTTPPVNRIRKGGRNASPAPSDNGTTPAEGAGQS